MGSIFPSLDPAGQLSFCGRRAHVVTTAGRTFHSLPVENVFNRDPQVRRTALIQVEGGPALAVEPATWPLPPLGCTAWEATERSFGRR